MIIRKLNGFAKKQETSGYDAKNFTNISKPHFHAHPFFRTPMMIQAILWIFLGITLILPAPGTGAAPDPTLQIAGCKTGVILLDTLSQEKDSGIDFPVRVLPTGNQIGMKMLINMQIDLAITCKNPEILGQTFLFIKEKAAEIFSRPFSQDTFVIIVNKENPLNDISMSALRKIYFGEIQDWQELGGEPGEIWPLRLNPELGSGFSKLFHERTIGLEKDFAPHVRLMHSPRIAGDYIRKFKNAISYGSFSDIPPDVKIISLDNVMPSKETVTNGTYPVAITYYLSTIGKPAGRTKIFFDYLTSEKGQTAVGKFCFPYTE